MVALSPGILGKAPGKKITNLKVVKVLEARLR